MTACRSSQLRLTVKPGGAATMSSYYFFVFTNTGSTCTMRGFPKILAMKPTGAQVPLHVTDNFGPNDKVPPVRTITLASGESASFYYVTTANPNGNPTCVIPTRPPFGTMKVIPPNNKTPIVVFKNRASCPGKRIAISPIVAGSSPHWSS